MGAVTISALCRALLKPASKVSAKSQLYESGNLLAMFVNSFACIVFRRVWEETYTLSPLPSPLSSNQAKHKNSDVPKLDQVPSF